MKKLGLVVGIGALALVLSTGSLLAQTTFTVSASLPSSDGVDFNVSKVTGGTWTAQSASFTDLDFGELSRTVDGVFLPDHYWVIDVSPNAVGSPDIDIAYNDTGAPTGVALGNGLAKHGVFSYAEIISGATEVTNVIGSMSFGQANGATIQKEDYADGFLRLQVSIATGDPTSDEGNAIPFTSSDAPGDYTGELQLTAVFDTP